MDPEMNPDVVTDKDCVFCERIFTGQVELINNTLKVVAFRPLNPVTEGHILVVPINHSSNAMADPTGAAKAFMFATHLAAKMETQANFITSSGPDATQTIMHTHIHMVPRTPGDGLKLPWTDQETRKTDVAKCLHVNPDDNTVWCVEEQGHLSEHQGFSVSGKKIYWENQEFKP